MKDLASALDAVSTVHIENLTSELKREYIIVLFTRKLQHAVRTSEGTVHMHLG